MIRGKRLISLLLTLMLCLGLAIQVNAVDLSDTKKKAQELEEKKKAAEGEKASLEAQLSSIVSEMEDTKTKIDKKEAEITEKEDELIQAKVDENDQYESMKKRIKYMYENGNSQFIEILCESKSIGDFLNNAEYITTISEYDRDMLVEFQEVVKKVEDQEAALKEEYAELETMQNDLIAKQDEVSGLMASKEDEISKLDSELGDTKDKLSQLEAAAAAAQRKQNESGKGYDPGKAGGAVVTGNGIGSAFLQNEWKNDHWGFLIGGRLDKHNLINHVISVSYTHLDVYKRQPSRCSGSRQINVYFLLEAKALAYMLGW